MDFQILKKKNPSLLLGKVKGKKKKVTEYFE